MILESVYNVSLVSQQQHSDSDRVSPSIGLQNMPRNTLGYTGNLSNYLLIFHANIKRASAAISLSFDFLIL